MVAHYQTLSDEIGASKKRAYQAEKTQLSRQQAQTDLQTMHYQRLLIQVTQEYERTDREICNLQIRLEMARSKYTLLQTSS